MNKYVPQIVLVLNFKEDTETYYKMRNEYFSVYVPHSKKYQTDITDGVEINDVIRTMTTVYYDKHWDEEICDEYEIEFIDPNFKKALKKQMESVETLASMTDPKGYAYAMTALV